MHDFKKIEELTNIVRNAMLEKFPECSYTIKVLLWDDGTSAVTCIHGTGEVLYHFRYYKDKLSFEESADHDGIVMTEDENGVERYFELVEIPKPQL